MAASGILPAIFQATPNSRVRTSMAFGSDLESGWSGSAVGDQGTSFGWYQIHLPAHPGVTQQQAEDPVASTGIMLKPYESAVAQVPVALWQSNPELAAEKAAFLAERPAGPEPGNAVGPYGSEGIAVVNNDWNATANTLRGQWDPGSNITLTSANTSGGNSGSGSTGNSFLDGILNALFPGSGTALSFLSKIGSFLANPVDAAERIGLVLFGAIIIIVGLVVLAQGNKTVRSAEGVAIGAATRGAGSRIYGSVSGSTADKAARQANAAEANKIGERKLALKERREARLAMSRPAAKPAQGKHAKPVQGKAA